MSNYLRLSYAQQRIWMEWKLYPESYAYNNSLFYRFDGDLCRDAFEKALFYLVSKRAALRAQFFEKAGVPYQRISKSIAANLDYFDLSATSEKKQVKEINNIFNNNVKRPFNLYCPPLFRFTLIKIQSDKFYFILNIHHIAVDGYSASLLLQDISLAYFKYRNGEQICPKVDDSSYIKFVEEEINYDSNINSGAKRHWQSCLEGVKDGDIQLTKHDCRESECEAYLGNRIHFTLPFETKKAIKKIAKSNRTTTFLFLVTVFAILIYKYTAQRKLVIGYPIDVRKKAHRELFGCFINNLPLIVDIKKGISFLDLLDLVKQRRRQDREFEAIPMQNILDFAREKNPALSRLFNISFIRANFALNGLDLDKVSVTSLPAFTHAVKDDLALLFDEGENLEFEIEYSRSIYDEKFINNFISNYINLLNTVSASPCQKIDDIMAVDNCSYKKYLKNYNRLNSHKLKKNNFIEYFDSVSEKYFDQTAVVFKKWKLNYSDLNRRANQFARELLKKGVNKGCKVALCIARQIDLLVTLLAVQKIGAIYIPLDPFYPKDRLIYIIEQSEADFIIFERVFTLPVKSKCKLIDFEQLKNCCINNSDENIKVTTKLDDVVYIIYTSGSTGYPKGVVIKQRGLVNFLESMIEATAINFSDKVLALTTIAFDISGLELYLPLMVGAQVVIADKNVTADVFKLKKLIKEYDISLMQATPATWQMLLDSQWQGKKSLTALCGGEALSHALAIGLIPKVRSLWNLYGPTETTIWSMVGKVTLESPINIGKPINNTAIYILDDSLNPVPIGATGEIYIAGEGLAKGYYGQRNLTALSFVSSSKLDNLRIYKTGDLAVYASNGILQYVGRKDNQVKLRGYRIELDEIEANLKNYPDVTNCAVVVKEFGHDDKRLVVFYCTKNREAVKSRAMIEFLQKKLPNYMIPSHYVCIDKLPLSPSKKIDRKTLVNHFQNKNDINDCKKNNELPNNNIEKIIHEIFCTLLKKKNISIHANFFSLGGHSLLATQLISEVDKYFHISLPLTRFFKVPTIANVAAYIQDESTIKRIEDKLSKASGTNILIPMSSSQQRFWFLEQLQKNIGQNNIAFCVTFLPVISADIVKKAIQKIIDIQSSLRTFFIKQHSQLYQTVSRKIHWELEFFEFDDKNEIKNICENISRKPFELGKAPLFRFAYGYEDNCLRLICVFHHIIFDGSSVSIFLKQLSTCIACILESKELPNLKHQYADYVFSSLTYYKTSLYQQQLELWRKELELCPITVIDTDFSRNQKSSYNGEEYEKIIPDKVSKNIFSNVQSYGLTNFVQLISAFYVLIYEYRGQDDLCVGVPAAVRPNVDFQETIGCFINNLPLRVCLSGNPSFNQIMQRVKSVCVAAIEKQRVPFESIVESLNIVRKSNFNPIFSIMFNVQEFNKDPFGSHIIKLNRINTHTSKYDLTFDVNVKEDKIELVVQYSVELFKDKTIISLVKSYISILSRASKNIYIKLDELSGCKNKNTIELHKSYDSKMIGGKNDYIEPKSKFQIKISEMWRSRLKIEKVGLNNNFFELGGHSLLATKLISDISREFNVIFPLYKFFEIENLEQFCEYVADKIENKRHTLKLENEVFCMVDKFPLAFKYKGMFFLHQYAYDKSINNICVALKLVGKLDFSKLKKAIKKLVVMHDILRMSFFVNEENEFYAKVSEKIDFNIESIPSSPDISKLGIDKFCRNLAKNPISITDAPLWRLFKVDLSKNEVILIFVFHHIISDEWSIDIFIRELTACYNQEKIVNNSLSFRQYNELLFRRKETEPYQKSVSYWRDNIKNIAPTSLLSFQDKFVENPDKIRKQAICKFSQPLSEKVQKVAKIMKKSCFLLLLTAFKYILKRYTGDSSVCVGSVVANRSDYRFKDTIGFLVDNIILKTSFSDLDTFHTALNKVEKSFLQALNYSVLTYSEVVELFHSQGFSGEPVKILFVMNHPYKSPNFLGLNSEIIEPLSASGEYELIFALRELENGLFEIKVDYCEIYNSNFVEEFIDNYISFIEICLSNADKKISSLSFIYDVCKNNSLNKNISILGQKKTVIEQFDKIAIKYSDNTAIICQTGKLTYRQLSVLRDRLVFLIQDWFFEGQFYFPQDSIVAVSMTPSAVYVATILAILNLGAAFLPIDSSMPIDRIKYILKDSGATIFITDQGFLANNSVIKTFFIDKNIVNKVLKSADFITSAILAPSRISYQSLAYVIYTSGTTGFPKGVMLEQHSLINFVNAIRKVMGFTSDDKMLQFASIGFDASVWEMFATLLSGFTLCIPDKADRIIGEPLQNYIIDKKITTAILPPSLLSYLDSKTLYSLDKLAVGGESCKINLVKEWASANRLLVNAYGPTEATICTTVAELSSSIKEVVIGKPIDNTDIFLLDDRLQPVPVGCIGEIYITGSGLARKYTDDQLTFKKFVDVKIGQDSFRCYGTGDLARYNQQGNLVYQGRKDRQIKINGLRIELQEIESCFLRLTSAKYAHALIDEDNKIRLFYTGYKKFPFRKIFDELCIHLPSYMVPNYLIYLDKFPLTVNGKIDEKALLKIRNSKKNIVNRVRHYDLSKTEKVILMMWEKIMKKTISSTHDDFFHLGGSSLQIMEILANINKEFNIGVTIKMFYKNPTIFLLAKYVDSQVD